MMKMRNMLALFLFAGFMTLCSQALKLSPQSWDKAEKLYPGMLHLAIEATEPRIMKLHAVRIDVGSGNFSFFSTPKADIWGKPMPDFPSLNAVTQRQTTRNFLLQAREKKSKGGYGLPMVLAINASPWTPWQAPFTHKYAAAMGLSIAQGDIMDSVDKGRPSFVVLKKGGVDFRTAKNPIAPEDIFISCPGFAVVLENGVLEPGSARRKDLAPRTGYGLSKDRKTLFLLVVDGRQPDFSMGCTVGEVGQILHDLGAEDALNMDGGGSTTLVVWDKHRPRKDKDQDKGRDKGRDRDAERARILNHQGGGAQRNVGNNLGIVLERH